jgi:hypothetical protein
MDPSQVTHHAEAIAKCPTIRLGVSDECFTYCNPGANMNECPSFRATHACSDGLPPTGTDYGNGLRFCVTNARIICRSKNGHCHIWTVGDSQNPSKPFRLDLDRSKRCLNPVYLRNNLKFRRGGGTWFLNFRQSK